jgi:hypothetical protein
MKVDELIEIARREPAPEFSGPLLPAVLERLEESSGPELRVLATACAVSGAAAAILGIVVLAGDPPAADPLDALVASLEPRIP